MSDQNDKQSVPEFTKDPIIEAYKKDVDRTLIRANLLLTVDQRVEQLMKLQQFAEDLQRGRKETREK